jgi:pSer/pThr/pTyr-binding forkhead associated (FHA) protein
LTPKQSDSSSSSNGWHIVASGDWLSGQRFAINQHAVLGRDSSCDITIPGTHLSRRHAELAVSGNKLLVRDLGSSNGTFVNDKQVTETELQAGDTIRFDVLTFTVEEPSKEEDNATIVRPPDTPSQKLPANKSLTPTEKQWKSKPTSVGNRDKTIQISTTQKAAGSLWNLLAVLIGIGTLVAIAYLFFQL